MSKGTDFRSSQGASRTRLDLNLLEPLSVFLEERSVSMAAVRLRVSQPTASNLLAKLRRHFNDPLLVRQGNAYTLSSLALHLKEDLPSALQAVERITTAQMAFDPLSVPGNFIFLAPITPLPESERHCSGCWPHRPRTSASVSTTCLLLMSMGHRIHFGMSTECFSRMAISLSNPI